jgi:hypothetical protein
MFTYAGTFTLREADDSFADEALLMAHGAIFLLPQLNKKLEEKNLARAFTVLVLANIYLGRQRPMKQVRP